MGWVRPVWRRTPLFYVTILATLCIKGRVKVISCPSRSQSTTRAKVHSGRVGAGGESFCGAGSRLRESGPAAADRTATRARPKHHGALQISSQGQCTALPCLDPINLAQQHLNSFTTVCYMGQVFRKVRNVYAAVCLKQRSLPTSVSRLTGDMSP